MLLLTGKVAFSGFMSGVDLVLLEKGITRDTLVVVSVAFSVGEVVLSAAISGIAAGSAPLTVFMQLFPPRMASMLVCCLLLLYVPNGAGVEGLETWWIVLFLAAYAVFKACSTGSFIAQMAFHNKIADPAIGGTYMTLLNTIANLGWMWVAPLALLAMEAIETHTCQAGDGAIQVDGGGTAWGADCATPASLERCTAQQGQCVEVRDGFSMVSAVCFVLGIVWFVVMAPRAAALQAAPLSAWRAPRATRVTAPVS
jgi:PAT family acetyl-CoA transporter-like MFS transporter 1